MKKECSRLSVHIQDKRILAVLLRLIHCQICLADQLCIVKRVALGHDNADTARHRQHFAGLFVHMLCAQNLKDFAGIAADAFRF